MRQLYDDTIVAPATAAGAAGLAVVRLSGNHALDIGGRLFEGADLRQSKSHRAHHGWVRTVQGEHLDEVLALVLRRPHSYTGEDTVEFSCHGSQQVVDELVEAAIAAGARLAEPGEFTRRAFLNGKLDLAQAEAVADLIDSNTRAARRAALEQLRGRLSARVESTRQDIMDVLADFEASIDFVEEALEFYDRKEVARRLRSSIEDVEALIATAADGLMLRSGVRVCLAGAPNVGKSSLFNRLVQEQRSIVTEHPGTTRDVVSEVIRLGGATFILEDTAGLRDDADDPVEVLGVERSWATHAAADIIVFVLDATRNLLPVERRVLDALDPERSVIVWNKIDLLATAEETNGLRVSARTGEGLDELLRAVQQHSRLRGLSLQNDALVAINQRHRESLERARQALLESERSMQASEFPEVLATDLRAAVSALGEVSGESVTESILDAVFSRFCIGK